ncbi:MAG: hypothetical protein F4Y11_07635 [Chloroflexi bacterium]|nr:hypothetical protein [Chloroflexota bacterium]
MDVTEAVVLAKEYVSKVFDEDKITGMGLEEVEFNEFGDEWEITIGFFQPWNVSLKSGSLSQVAFGGQPEYVGRRSYKVVRIKNNDGQVVSIRDRILEPKK